MNKCEPQAFVPDAGKLNKSSYHINVFSFAVVLVASVDENHGLAATIDTIARHTIASSSRGCCLD